MSRFGSSRFEVRDATALVTGGGAGIGAATARRLGAEGADVWVTDVNAASAEHVAAEIVAAGGRAHARRLDVSCAPAVAAVADELAATCGGLDVLVCNAGVGMSGRFRDMTLDDWAWIRGVNLDGVVHCCHAFGPAMLERRRGRVVLVSSGLGYTPRATESAYVTTKAAVLALAQCLRADWGRDGVGVSAVCPGVINTGIIERTRFVGAHARAHRVERVFRRGHRPESVAAAIVAAIRENRVVVPVGWESHLGWWAHRLTPVAAQQRLARVAL